MMPVWARKAFGSATAPNPEAIKRHAALIDRVGDAWPGLGANVVPQFDQLPDDLVRQRIFTPVAGLLIAGRDKAYFAERRKKQREADRLASVIAKKAGELAVLLHERGELLERTGGLSDELPDLFECLEDWYVDAVRHPEYDVWAHVAADAFREFLRIAQSRPGPGLVELLNVVAEGPRVWPRADARPQQSRKVTSALAGTLLHWLDPHVLASQGAPADFSFTDASIAELLTVLFDRFTDADDVRKLRASSGRRTD